MINLSEVITDPDLSQGFTILRSNGAWTNGVWIEGTPTAIGAAGVISVAKEKELRVLPEADRPESAMVFHATVPIYVSRVSPAPATADLLVWNGENYRTLYVWPYGDYGFYKAIAVRMAGD